MTVICVFIFLSLVAGVECRGTLCLCERGERQPACVPSCIFPGVYRVALTTMEASARPDCLGHTPHFGIHLHLQPPYHHAMGPGTSPLCRAQIRIIFLLQLHL